MIRGMGAKPRPGSWFPGLLSASDSPTLPVEAAVMDSFREVFRGDLRSAFQAGNGP